MPNFPTVYADHFAFVWRSLRHLGVLPHSLDDAAQDVFLVVHRRLEEFDGCSPLRAWLFVIAHRVALGYHRRERRKGGLDPLPQSLVSLGPGPHQRLQQMEAAQWLGQFLDTLDDGRRVVFVMAELEQLTGPEISEALGVNVNTVYSRLRAARAAFERAIQDTRRGDP